MPALRQDVPIALKSSAADFARTQWYRPARMRASLLILLTACTACAGGNGNGKPTGRRELHDELTARNGARRESSVAPFLDTQVGTEPLLVHASHRTAYVLDGATSIELVDDPAVNATVYRGMADGKIVTSEIGAAAAISDDGYFLTAAHCVSTGKALLVRATPGRPARESEAIVVWRSTTQEPPADLAILWAPDLAGPAFTWAPGGVATAAPVLCVGSGARGLPVAGGRLVERDPTARTFTVDVPLLPGDSGGPCLLADGSLLGVTIQASITEGSRRGTVTRPDTTWLASVLAADRVTRKGGPQPKARPTTAGALRTMGLEADVARLLGTTKR